MSKPITLTHLPEDLARFAEAQVATGRFPNVEGILEASLQAMKLRQLRHDEKVAAPDAALQEGEQSGLAGDGVFDRVRGRLGLPAAR